MWSWHKLRLIDGVTGEVSMHSRGLSDMFQPCGVARVMDTVDDDRPLTASAVTEKKYRPVWSVNDKICPASRSWSPRLLALGLGPELSLSHATAQRPGAGMSRVRDAEDCHTFSPLDTSINLKMIDSILDKHLTLRKFVSLSTAREETRRIGHQFCQTMLIDQEAVFGAARSTLVTITRRHRTDSSTQSHIHWSISTPAFWIGRSGLCIKISYQPSAVGVHELVVDMEYSSPKFDCMETRQPVAFYPESQRLDRVLFALLQSDGVLRPGTSIQNPQTDCVQVKTKNESTVCKYFWQVDSPWPCSATGVPTTLSTRTLDDSDGSGTGPSALE
ncbi:hypothetical protein ASPFODRAFT_84415 [Aspergillus luchuensis CBS 106.47]|uniref:Uncharacterized protein n=1 Tax=Aspergillus luchuensis (strain CBS 106.47) TaxID=1137211 RepID=A0A1M3T5Z2_ASPLC|nr:hypothetical protein ASPFODRAFT_84415 [Aspergillus luchuensis CBS 106.47]